MKQISGNKIWIGVTKVPVALATTGQHAGHISVYRQRLSRGPKVHARPVVAEVSAGNGRLTTNVVTLTAVMIALRSRSWSEHVRCQLRRPCAGSMYFRSNCLTVHDGANAGNSLIDMDRETWVLTVGRTNS